MVNKPRFQKYKKETAFKLFKIAQDDLHSAKILFSAPTYRPENVVYHIQQCIEKCLKAVIIQSELSVPLTHDLDLLIEQLDSKLTKSLPEGVGELSQYATLKRYIDGDELIEKKDIETSFTMAHFFVDWAKKVLYP